MTIDWEKLGNSAERARKEPLKYGIYLTTEQMIELVDSTIRLGPSCFCNRGGTVKGTTENPRPVHKHWIRRNK